MTDTTDLIQRLREHRGDYAEEMDEAADALEQQAAQIEALRADAERLDWIERQCDATSYPTQFTREPHVGPTYVRHGPDYYALKASIGSGPWQKNASGGSIREAIDAALRQEQPNE